MFATPGTPSQVRLTGRRAPGLLLAGILLLAAILRLAALPHSPPGLNQDEAANAWNAWCLLHTGRDQAGESWPIFYFRALGENRSALHLYPLLLLQSVGGLNVWTTRLPQAVAGVLTVLVVYGLGRRLFDRSTGLAAAALLAISPWHILLSRLGLEAGLAPLLTCVPLLAIMWAGLPLATDVGAGEVRRGVTRALLAGLVTGGACYGYAAVRLFLPPFVVLGVALSGRAWWRLLWAPRGRRACAGFLSGLALTLGPLAYQHVAHGADIARRTENIWLWSADDAWSICVAQVAARYVAHFDPRFLFADGDAREIYSVPGFGVYHWYLLPLGVAGAIVLAWRRTWPDRLLLLWLALYPVADSLFRTTVAADAANTQPYLLRSTPGLMAPILVGALGLVETGRWLRRRQRLFRPAAVVAGGVLLASAATFARVYFGTYPRGAAVQTGFHADLWAACQWLRPRYGDADAVFITASGMNMPYVVTLVGLGYEPREWFTDERDVRTFEGLEWEYVFRFGRFHFVYDRSVLAAVERLEQNGRADRVIFIMRPHELRWTNPTETIVGPDGNVALVAFDVEL